MPAALSGGPGVLLQQLLGSTDLQPVVRGLGIHPHLESQAVDGFRPGGHAEGLVAQAELAEGLPSLPVKGGPGGLTGQEQAREVELLWGHPHEIPPDLQGGLRVLPAPVAGRSAAVAAPGPVAAGVGHSVTAAAGPEPSIRVDPFAPAVGKQLPAGFGADRADQIQMPASGGSTVQLGLCRWPVLSGLSLSGVHSRGGFRPQASPAPPPPKEGKRITHLGEADGLLVHLHQGPDITDPDGEHPLRHRPPGLSGGGLCPQAGEIQRRPLIFNNASSSHT